MTKKTEVATSPGNLAAQDRLFLRSFDRLNCGLLATADGVVELLVQAGLSPYEALRTATVNPAVYLEAEQEFGTIAPGLRADLVLLTNNPLEDIRNANTRVGVMKRGRWFTADELETALAELAEDRK